MHEAIDLFEQKCYDTAKARVHQFLGEYHSSAVDMMFQTILHYEGQLKELRAPKTCDTCAYFTPSHNDIGMCSWHKMHMTKKSSCKYIPKDTL